MPSVALRFEPVFREYIWGGRRLASVLGKPIGDGPRYAESWEVVDHGADQSVVSEGELASATLTQLMHERRAWLVGDAAASARFPLLLKYLDCNRNLSIQVHPDDEKAALLDPPDLGKTEAWYIIDAAADAKIYAGLREGVARADLSQAMESGEILRCLNVLQPSAGDCIFIPAGVVHALGEGLLVAEIQQASDTTYRLDDWGRVGDDGQPRPLHVAQGLDATDYEHGPVAPQQPSPGDAGSELLVTCDKFVLKRHSLAGKRRLSLGGDGRFHILTVVDGEAEIVVDEGSPDLRLGQTLLIPAASEAVEVSGQATVLDAHLPVS